MISDELFERLVARIIKDEQVERQLAERIMDQALVFLRACGDNPERSLRPSKQVDIGWHTFVLHTRDYARFCDRVAGRFIHHTPDEFEPLAGASNALAPTVTLLKATGLTVDEVLWLQEAGKCTQCHAGCTDCGQGRDDD